MKPYRKEEQPPKVIKMFRAVTEMLQEGEDLASIKVSQITDRAGIGKGTAYEYFSSKEEMIAGAVLYEVRQQYEQLKTEVEKKAGFKEKVNCILDWLAQNYSMHRTFEQMIRANTGSFCVPQSVRREFCMQNEGDDALQIIEHLLECGLKEGIISEENAFLRQSALVSQMMQYIFYMKAEGDTEGISPEKMKDVVYQGILRLLS